MQHHCLSALVFSVAWVAAGPASAAVFSFDLIDDNQGVSVSHGTEHGGAYEQGVLGLLDAASGLPITAGFTASLDDEIVVTLHLGAALTLPVNGEPPASANWPNFVSIATGSVDGTVIFGEQDLNFYLGAAQVGNGIYSGWGGSGGQLVAGGYTYSAGPGFTFDTVMFTARVFQIYDNNIADWTTSIAIDGIQPSLTYRVYTPVPEPSAGLLMACGLGAVSLLSLRRTRAGTTSRPGPR